MFIGRGVLYFALYNLRHRVYRGFRRIWQQGISRSEGDGPSVRETQTAVCQIPDLMRSASPRTANLFWDTRFWGFRLHRKLLGGFWLHRKLLCICIYRKLSGGIWLYRKLSGVNWQNRELHTANFSSFQYCKLSLTLPQLSDHILANSNTTYFLGCIANFVPQTFSFVVLLTSRYRKL